MQHGVCLLMYVALMQHATWCVRAKKGSAVTYTLFKVKSAAAAAAIWHPILWSPPENILRK